MEEEMTKPLRLVAVSGALHSPSRTTALAQHLQDLIAEALPCEAHLLELGSLAGPAAQWGGAINRRPVAGPVAAALAAVEQADVLVVATPVYRGAYTGLFKHFFDFIHQDALVDKPVLLAATGGSARHALVIEHQLRPLFSFFQARTLPLGVYATEQELADLRLRDEDLLARARLAFQRALPLLRLAQSAVAEEAALV
jgi:FMN reductase